MIYSNTEWKNEKFTLTQCGKVLKNTITILREKQRFFRQINVFTRDDSF